LNLSSGQSFPPESHWFDTTGVGAHHAGVTPTISRRRRKGRGGGRRGKWGGVKEEEGRKYIA